MSPADKILQKALVGSGLDTRGWSQIQAGLRDRAFFSAQVTQAKILHAMRQNVAELVKGGKSESEVRRDLREYLGSIGYDAGDNRGTIKDLMTKARLDVMIKTNADQARGYASHIRATSAGAILAFPAYELVRVERRKLQRDWNARWKAAAQKVGWEGVARNGSMIALKTSPIWAALSRFGNPFPPFDFNSGMGVRDVKKSVCREIGLLGEDEKPKIPETPDFNGNLHASVPFNGKDAEWNSLQDTFGDQIAYTDGEIVWKGELIQDVARGTGKVRLGKSTAELLSHFSGVDREHLKNTSLTISGDWVKQHAGKHIGENEQRSTNIPLEAGDYELIPTLWRSPEFVDPGKYAGSSVLGLETIDGGILRLVIDHRSGAMPLSFWKEKKSERK
jgi:hypothetical protein